MDIKEKINEGVIKRGIDKFDKIKKKSDGNLFKEIPVKMREAISRLVWMKPWQ